MCEPPYLTVALAHPDMCQTTKSAKRASKLVESFLATGFFEPCDECNEHTQGIILHAPPECIDDLPAGLLEYVRAFTLEDAEALDNPEETDEEIPF
jgi:hypothetical protein